MALPFVISASSSPEPDLRTDEFHVDVVHPSEAPSTQILPPQPDDSEQEQSSFVAYQSPLSEFPLLRPRTSQVVSSHLQHAVYAEPTQGSGFYVANTLINFRPLRLASAAKWLSDPGARICCLELNLRVCPPLHTSRLLTFIYTALPSTLVLSRFVDHEIAQFLCSVLPQSSHIDVLKLQEALKEARQRTSNTTVSLETRAAEALASLGIR
ncbi:hypothetical protein EIP91_005798 [Steccherinum ochraceum]|uniref:Uncharacterized protein n=1 Tax=Steccherinum ochraceum TaxID=92696 RepID=A0A4R0R6Z9_9APHY|nr:hypothetical protein EIP91_005798 [Steccherinum ochraceum]